MNLTEYIQSSTGYSPTTVSSVVEAFCKFVQVSLRRGEEVKLEKFGNFVFKDTPERPGRNPRTGESIKIPSKRRPDFKFSKTFIASVQPDAAIPMPEGHASLTVNYANADGAIAQPVNSTGSDSFVTATTETAPAPETRASKNPPAPTSSAAPATAAPENKKLPPPIPASLLSNPGRTWYISGANNAFVEVPESSLLAEGVTPETPLWSESIGSWKLAKDIPEVGYLFPSPAAAAK